MNGGLLIVNADDCGLRTEITDAILAVHAGGRITSATAMVHMEDTTRAVALAGESGLPLGLHLNLTYPYSAPDAPASARARQARLVRYFSRRLTRYAYDPRVRGLIADCIQDQLEAFLLACGAPPTHVDGHQHIHACPSVATSPALAPVARARCAHTYARGERSAAKRLPRAVQNRLLRARFRTPAAFLPVGDVHPDLGGSGLERLELARTAAVEVMVHAQRPQERDALESAAWGETMGRYRTGSFEQL